MCVRNVVGVMCFVSTRRKITELLLLSENIQQNNHSRLFLILFGKCLLNDAKSCINILFQACQDRLTNCQTFGVL